MKILKNILGILLLVAAFALLGSLGEPGECGIGRFLLTAVSYIICIGGAISLLTREWEDIKKNGL